MPPNRPASCCVWLMPCPPPHQFTLEVIFHNRLRRAYPCLTTNAEEADLLYIPYYAALDAVHWNFAKDATTEDKDELSLALTHWVAKKPHFKVSSWGWWGLGDGGCGWVALGVTYVGGAAVRGAGPLDGDWASHVGLQTQAKCRLGERAAGDPVDQEGGGGAGAGDGRASTTPLGTETGTV